MGAWALPLLHCPTEAPGMRAEAFTLRQVVGCGGTLSGGWPHGSLRVQDSGPLGAAASSPGLRGVCFLCPSTCVVPSRLRKLSVWT